MSAAQPRGGELRRVASRRPTEDGYLSPGEEDGQGKKKPFHLKLVLVGMNSPQQSCIHIEAGRE